MCHTFYLAPAILGERATPRECMKWAYKQAGEAMLVEPSVFFFCSNQSFATTAVFLRSSHAKVTTVTTAGSFYANCVSVLVVVKQFGFFMGAPAALRAFCGPNR